MSAPATLNTLVNLSVIDPVKLNENFTALRTSLLTSVFTDEATEITVGHEWSAGQTWSVAQQFFAGTAAAPGVAIGEADSGFYRIGAGNIGMSIGGTKRWDYAAAGSTLTGNLTVTGSTSLQTVTGGTYNGQTISSATSLTGTLAVAGASTLASLSVTGNATVGGTFGATGNATFGGSVTVTGVLNANGGIAGTVTGNADTATTLATARNFSITGDGTASAVSFNGSAAVALNLTLSTVAATKGGTGISSYTANNYLRAATTTTLEQRTPAQVLSDIGAAASSHSHAFSALTGNIAVSQMNGGTGASATTVWKGDGTWGQSSVFEEYVTFTGEQSTTLTGTTNDLALTDVAVLRLNLGGVSRTLTGLTNGTPGRLLWIVNVDASEDLTLAEETGSSAANRFLGGTGASQCTVRAGKMTPVVYTGSRWVPISFN